MCVHKVWGGQGGVFKSIIYLQYVWVHLSAWKSSDWHYLYTLASTSTRSQTHGTVTINWRSRLFAFHFMSLGFLYLLFYLCHLFYFLQADALVLAHSLIFFSCNSWITDDKSTSHSHLLNISSLILLRLSRILILVCQVPFFYHFAEMHRQQNSLGKCTDVWLHECKRVYVTKQTDLEPLT